MNVPRMKDNKLIVTTNYIRAILLILFAMEISGCNVSYERTRHPLSGSDEVPFKFLKNDSIVSIDQVGNYCDVKKEFSLRKPTRVKVKASGEILMGKENGKRDVFEMYFDLINGKSKQYDSKINRFFYFSEIDGSSDGVSTVFSTLSQHKYVIEIAYPRNLLGIDLTAGKRMGFDFAFSDNDNGSSQEKQIAWHANDSDIWLDPSLWGSLRLVSAVNEKTDDTTVLSVFSDKGPALDGKLDTCWARAPQFEARKVLYGTVDNSVNHADIIVRLRSLWDEKYIYFFVEVEDDNIVKQSYMAKVFDYGWIETGAGQVVWKMDMHNVKHAGGARKNFCADTVLQLPAGKYMLGYHSDESHAYGQWDDDPPLASFYGITLKLF